MKALIHFAIIALFLSIAFIFNKIPDDAIVAGGDFYQLINFSDQLERYKYAWFNQVGQGVPNPLFVTYPYYLLFSVINRFLLPGQVAASILFFFLTASFYSFYYSLKHYFKEYDFLKGILVSLLYSLNPFVLTIFTYTWGYTHHFLLYMFLPILVANFSKILMARKMLNKDLCSFIIINFIAMPAYGNLSYFVLVLLIYGLISLLILVTRVRNLNFLFIKRILLLFSVLFILILPILVPTVLTVIANSGKGFTSQEALGGSNYLYEWIKNTSNTPFNAFNLLLDGYRYPFSNSKIHFFGIILNSIYFLLLLTLIYFNIYNLKIKKKTLLVPMLLSFLVFLFLSFRYYGPFEYINKIIYQSPFFIFFRSPDKIFVAVAFFYTLTISFLLEKIKLKNQNLVFSIIILIVTIPYLMGTISYSLNNSYNAFANKTRPEYTYIVTIPEEYYNLADIINNDSKQTAVLSLPYSVKNSINWSNYPSWGLVGHDVTHLLFDKRLISANTFDHPASEIVMSFKKLADGDKSADEIFKHIKKFGVEYVIYHKDIDRALYNASKGFYEKILELVDAGTLEEFLDNEYFTTYKVVSDMTVPLISLQNGSVTYKKINPTLYLINTSDIQGDTLKFLQSYEPEWKLGLVERKQPLCAETYSFDSKDAAECVWEQNSFFDSSVIESQLNPVNSAVHELCDDYANCWELSDFDASKYTLVLYYTKQNFVYALVGYGVIVSALVSMYFYKNK